MKVTVTINKSKIKSTKANALKAVGMVAEQLRTEVIQAGVIPFDEGTLQNVQTYIDVKSQKQGLIKIYHDTPYAARLYHHPEYNFQTTHNRNARGEWWHDWIEGSKKNRAHDLFRAFLKRLIGD